MRNIISNQNRRNFLKQAAMFSAAAPFIVRAHAADRPIFTTVDTEYGKLQGMDMGGVVSFRGIPYGGPTGGKNRFMPATKPLAWTGVREAFDFGAKAPQTIDTRSDYVQLIEKDQLQGGMGEDCLVLNVWTPAVDGAARPVMVSLHGGGFTNGAGAGSYYGPENLARFGDAVVVTLNHRLASFGFLHLEDLGAPPEFAQSGTNGMTDLVAALQWVRANIGRFGGDPARVMIFGQSGGGLKTSVMMAMPSAKGLFHRAAAQSGSWLRAQSREAGTAQAEKFLKALGLDKSRIGELQKRDWKELLTAQDSLPVRGPEDTFLPVMDGNIIPQHPFDPVAPAVSADVPIIVSTTLDDASFRIASPTDLDEAGLKEKLKTLPGGQPDRVYKMYRAAYPELSPFLIYARAFTDADGRLRATALAERKAALGSAPAYLYLLAWASPGYDGKFGSVHVTDVPLVFHMPRAPINGAANKTARKLADEMAGAWVAFARTGDPNHKGIPQWAPYDSEKRSTMIFDADTRAESDPRREFRELWNELAGEKSER